MADPASEPLLREERAELDAKESKERTERAEDDRRASIWDSLEDPEDTIGLLDEDQVEARATVYKQEVEQEHLQGQDPSSPQALAKQLGLCGTLVFITVYEAVLKGRAVREATFDFTSLLIMQALVSVVAGLALAVICKQTDALKAQFAWQVARYAPVGLLFGAGAYVQLIAYYYLSADVFKVLEQTRLLVLAILGYVLLRKKLSTSSWVALLTITLTCLTYGRMKTAVQAQAGVQRELERDLLRTEKVHEHFQVPEVFARQNEVVRAVAVDAVGGLAGSRQPPAGQTQPDLGDTEVQQQALAVARDAALLAPEASELKESLTKLVNQSLGESKSPLIGFSLTAIFVLLVCFASIYSEKILKTDKHIPYYIQKVYQELTAGLFSVFASFCLRPLLMNNGIAKEKLKISFADEGNLLFGWDNALVPVLFVFFLAKAWLSGLIVKQLSAIAKQLCSIVAVVLVYFFLLMHDCKFTDDPKAFFCPANIASASFNIIIIDLGVLAAVVSYTTALRDKKRKTMFKQRIGELEAEAK